MKLRKKKGRVYDTVKYMQAKASKVKQSHIIQYRDFGHLARNCRNQGIEMSRRIETEDNY